MSYNLPTTVVGRFGSIIDFSALHKSKIVMDDVYDCLSKTFRFNGGTAIPFNILQHQILVCKLAQSRDFDDYQDPAVALLGLIHDLSEAFTGDIVKPLKEELDYESDRLEVIEREVFHLILKELGLRPEDFTSHDIETVKELDERAAIIEWVTLNEMEFINPAGTWSNYGLSIHDDDWDVDTFFVKTLSPLQPETTIQVYKDWLTKMVRRFNGEEKGIAE